MNLKATQSDPSRSVGFKLNIRGFWYDLGTLPDNRGYRRVRYQWCCTRCGEPWLREVDCEGSVATLMGIGPCCGEPDILPNFHGCELEMLPASIMYAELAKRLIPNIRWKEAVQEFQWGGIVERI